MNKIIINPQNYSVEEYEKLQEYLSNTSLDHTELKSDTNNLLELKVTLYSIIALAEEVIDQLPQKGDKCSDCQRMCLQQAINEFSYVVNGIEESDLEE